MIFVQEPTFINPDALDTVPELRRALHLANVEVRRYWAAINEREFSGLELITLINGVLTQHVRGDHRGVAAILDAKLDANPRLREKLEEANESAEIRQIGAWAKAANKDRKADTLPPYNCEGEDPWSTKTALELRRALDVANRAGVSCIREAKDLNRMLEEITEQIAPIFMAHIQGDRDAASQALSAFCEKYVVVSGTGLRRVH